jgi:hypothetical protein
MREVEQPPVQAMPPAKGLHVEDQLLAVVHILLTLRMTDIWTGLPSDPTSADPAHQDHGTAGQQCSTARVALLPYIVDRH